MKSEMFYGATPNSFKKARWLRSKMTKHEEMLWARLKNNQILGARIRRQHPIGTYVADFYCHAAKLVVEVDGDGHDAIEQKSYDAERTFNFEIDGLKVLRFSNQEVQDDLDGVVREIAKEISERLPPRS